MAGSGAQDRPKNPPTTPHPSLLPSSSHLAAVYSTEQKKIQHAAVDSHVNSEREWASALERLFFTSLAVWGAMLNAAVQCLLQAQVVACITKDAWGRIRPTGTCMLKFHASAW